MSKVFISEHTVLQGVITFEHKKNILILHIGREPQNIKGLLHNLRGQVGSLGIRVKQAENLLEKGLWVVLGMLNEASLSSF